MAISRRWKLISGTTGVAVALSAGAAFAADGGSSDEVVLDDVKEISDIVATTSTTFIESPEPMVILDDSVATPFDDEVVAPVADESIESPDESIDTVDSPDSVDSPDQSMDSPDSVDSPDQSMDSPDSVDSPDQSMDSPDSVDSPDQSMDSPDSVDSP